MPHVYAKSTKWRRFVIHIGFFLLIQISIGTTKCLHDSLFDAMIIASLDKMYAMEYTMADTILAGLPQDSPAKPYFSGLVAMNRFADLGDTSALHKAEKHWESLIPGKGKPSFRGDSLQLHLYSGLAGLQISYAHTLRGSSIKAATVAWKARGELLPLSEFAEANAALALFEYYRTRFMEHLNFLPFLSSNASLPLQRLEQSTRESRYLKDLLQSSIFWIRFDRKEIAEALKIADDFLIRYPKNRLVKQMRGDALIRAGRWVEARKVYESLLADYQAMQSLSENRKNIPIGYFCSVGNLFRIYSGLGRKDLANTKWKEWKLSQSDDISPWLPPSLKKEVARLPHS